MNVELKSGNLTRKVDKAKLIRYSEAYRQQTDKPNKYDLGIACEKPIFDAFCDYVNEFPYWLDRSANAFPLKALASLHGVKKLMWRCAAFLEWEHAPRPVVIASWDHPEHCLEIVPDAPLEDSVVLGSRRNVSLANLFVLIGTQIISCLSGLALQFNDLHAFRQIFGSAKGVLGQGVPDAFNRRQKWEYNVTEGAIKNSFGDVVEIRIRKCYNGASLWVVPRVGNATKKWMLQDPPANFVLGEFLNPGLCMKFDFPKVRIVPLKRPDLVIAFDPDSSRADGSVLRLAHRNGAGIRDGSTENQLFWWDEMRGVFINCKTRLALSLPHRKNGPVVLWAPDNSSEQRWLPCYEEGTFVPERLIVQENMEQCLCCESTPENGVAVVCATPKWHDIRQKWIIEHDMQIAQHDDDQVWPLPLLYRRVLEEQTRALALLADERLENPQRKRLENDLRSCHCALLTFFMADYLENRKRRLPGWSVWNDPGVCQAWGLDRDNMEAVQKVLQSSEIGVLGELFFPVQLFDGHYISHPILVLLGAPGFNGCFSESPSQLSDLNLPSEANKWFGTEMKYQEPQYMSRLRNLRDCLRTKLPENLSFVVAGHGTGARLAVELANLLHTSVVTFNPIGLTALGDQHVPREPGQRPGQTEVVSNYVVENEIVSYLDQEIENLQQTGSLEMIQQHLMQICHDVKGLDAQRLSLWQSITPTVGYRVLLFLLLRFKSFEQGNLDSFPPQTFHPIPVMKEGEHGKVVKVSNPPQPRIHLQDFVDGLAQFSSSIKTLSNERIRGLMNWQQQDGILKDKIRKLVQTISGPGFATMVIDSFTISTELHTMASFFPYLRWKLQEDIREAANDLKESHPGVQPMQTGSAWIIGASQVGKSSIWSAIQARPRLLCGVTKEVRSALLSCHTPSGDNFQVELCDSPSGMLNHAAEFCHAALIILVVAQNDSASLPSSDLVNEALTKRIDDRTQFVIAVNKCDQPADTPSTDIKKLAEQLRCEDRVFHISVRHGKPGHEFHDFRETCHRILGDCYQQCLVQ